MHPILSNRRRLQWYLLCWLPIAAFVSWLIGRDGTLSWLESAAVAYPVCAAFAFACLSNWYVCRANPLSEATFPRAFGAIALAAVLTSELWVLAGRAWALLLDSFSVFPGLSIRYDGQGLFFYGILVFFLVAAVHYLLLNMEAARLADKRALELQVLAREAELKALRAQIDPHFLFNSLNSINALTMQDPAGARRMCLLLADFLRRSLQLGAKEKISFSDELQLAENFLDIEKVRFGERLDVCVEIVGDCDACQVPPLVIQPLIENAVRHGIAPLIEGGTLKIRAQRSGSRLEVTLENPFDEDVIARAGAGVGLQNVRARIENMFGGDGRVDVKRDHNHFKVTLRIPCAS